MNSDAHEASPYIDEFGARWEPIPGHTSYSVSDSGHIRNERFGKELRPRRGSQNGRLQITIVSDDGERSTFYIHRLVALMFLPDFDPAHQVRHISEDLLNNAAQNLEMSPYYVSGGRWY